MGAQTLQLQPGGTAGFVQRAFGRFALRQGARGFPLEFVTELQGHLHAQLDHGGGGAGEMVVRHAPGDVGLLLRAGAFHSSLGGGHAILRRAHIGAGVDQGPQGGIVGRLVGPLVGKSVFGADVWHWPLGHHHQALVMRVQVEHHGQGQCGATALQRHGEHVALGALGFNLQAQGILARQVAGTHTPRRRAGELRRAAGHGFDLQNPLLGRRQVEIGIGGRQQLQSLGFFQIALRGAGGALRDPGAQNAFVAALPGPVDADAFVDAFLCDQIAFANAVLQVDGTELGRQVGKGRAVSRHHVCLGRSRCGTGHGHVVVGQRCVQCLREGQR